jgi:hypothetical protein
MEFSYDDGDDANGEAYALTLRLSLSEVVITQAFKVGVKPIYHCFMVYSCFDAVAIKDYSSNSIVCEEYC